MAEANGHLPLDQKPNLVICTRLLSDAASAIKKSEFDAFDEMGETRRGFVIAAQ